MQLKPDGRVGRSKHSRPTDDEILEALGDQTAGMATYVVRNILSRNHRNLPTAFVLRRLKSLEQAGKAERAPSVYAVMICWRRTTKESLPDPLDIIQETAQQLLQWANESVAGGHDIHQVAPMRQKAKELYAIYGMHMAHRHKIADLITKAADLIAAHAEELRSAHSVDGEWQILDEIDAPAKADYEHEMNMVQQLRHAVNGSYYLPFHVKQG